MSWLKSTLYALQVKGGDLGEFKPGQMVRAFDEVVFKKAVLEVHGPIKTQFGYHLIKTLYRS